MLSSTRQNDVSEKNDTLVDERRSNDHADLNDPDNQNSLEYTKSQIKGFGNSMPNSNLISYQQLHPNLPPKGKPYSNPTEIYQRESRTGYQANLDPT